MHAILIRYLLAAQMHMMYVLNHNKHASQHTTHRCDITMDEIYVMINFDVTDKKLSLNWAGRQAGSQGQAARQAGRGGHACRQAGRQVVWAPQVTVTEGPILLVGAKRRDAFTSRKACRSISCNCHTVIKICRALTRLFQIKTPGNSFACNCSMHWPSRLDRRSCSGCSNNKL